MSDDQKAIYLEGAHDTDTAPDAVVCKLCGTPATEAECDRCEGTGGKRGHSADDGYAWIDCEHCGGHGNRFYCQTESCGARELGEDGEWITAVGEVAK